VDFGFLADPGHHQAIGQYAQIGRQLVA